MPDRDNFQPYDYAAERHDAERHAHAYSTWNGDSAGAEEAMSDEDWAELERRRG